MRRTADLCNASSVPCKVSHRDFDVVVLALSGTGFCRQQPATVDALKVGVRELVAALLVLVLLVLLVLNPEGPRCVLGDPVPLNVVVLLPGRRSVLAPCVTVIDEPARRDQVPRVLVSRLGAVSAISLAAKYRATSHRPTAYVQSGKWPALDFGHPARCIRWHAVGSRLHGQHRVFLILRAVRPSRVD
jgi:hypothetical protein